MTDVLIPGGRDVRGTLEEPAGETDDDAAADTDADADAIVVACPPHPQHGGSRSNGRLVAVAEALTDFDHDFDFDPDPDSDFDPDPDPDSDFDSDPDLESAFDPGIACLRFDYGEWDDGYGERADVRSAVRWADDRYDRVGLFGYSFGATLSLLVASELESVDAVSALAPTARLADDLDAAAAFDSIATVPIQVLYGDRDDTVDWEPIVERASERKDATVVSIPGDHFFVGQDRAIADAVGEFFGETLLEAE